MTATNIYYKYVYKVYTEFQQNLTKNSSVWDCTIYMYTHVIAVITVFSVLAYIVWL